MKAKVVKNTEPVVISLPFGRDEMNLAEFPTTLLSDHAPAGVKTLRFEDGQGGLLTITGSDAYGLPTASDADVLIGLIQLTKLRNDFTEAKVHFTRYELLRLLDWTNEGRSYNRLDQSLNRWMGVTLVYDDSWYDNRAKKVGSAKMHIIESVVIFDGSGKEETKGIQGSLPLSSFTWNKTFMESCQADNLKRLNLETYFSLRSAISKRIYRFLDKKFYRRDAIEFDLRDFAMERIGLSRSYAGNAGKIKEKLKTALEELEAIGFLEPLTKDVRYRREGRKWIIRLSQATAPALPVPKISQPDPSPLVQELISRGVSPEAASHLEATYPIEAIQFQIEHFDWLQATKHKNYPADSPGGWFVKALPGKYTPPPKFRTQAQIQKAEEAKREKDRQAKAAKDRQNEKEAEEERAHQARTAAVEAHLASLSPEALNQLDLDFRADGGFGPGKIPFKEQLFSGFIAKKLGL